MYNVHGTITKTLLVIAGGGERGEEGERGRENLLEKNNTKITYPRQRVRERDRATESNREKKRERESDRWTDMVRPRERRRRFIMVHRHMTPS